MAFNKTSEEAIALANRSGDVYPSFIFEGPSQIVVPPNASSLPREELVNKIKGIIYGNAIGDAIGLATEFMTKAEAAQHYGANAVFEYGNFVRDYHRKNWLTADWTDDTDQVILIIDGLLGSSGKVSSVDFAKRLKYWINHGFPVLGDVGGSGIGQTVMQVVNHPKFLESPHESAKAIWDKWGGMVAANGALMRTSPLGIVQFHDLNKVIENTKEATHYDPRCNASCIVFTTTIAMILQNKVDDYDKILDEAFTLAKKELKEHDSRYGYAEFERHVNVKQLSELELDKQSSIGYTYKCLGAALWAFKYGNDFKDAICQIVREAGDADTNAAVAGALMGAKYGYDKLPKDWVEGLLHKKFLDEKVDRFLSLLGLLE